MIAFREPKMEDRRWMAPLLQAEEIPLCSYGCHIILSWKDAYHYRVAPMARRLLIQLDSLVGPAFLWPAGSGDPVPAIEALARTAHEEGRPLCLTGLTHPLKTWLEERFPGRFAFREVREGFDYHYSVDRLAELPGKKLQAKRNHIHRLDDLCPGWTWTPVVSQQDAEDCLAMERAWQKDAAARQPPQEAASLQEERQALAFALRHREALGMEGILLRWQGELLGFSLGAPLTSAVFDVSFERARRDIQGTYPAVARSLARYVRETHPQIRYLDREEDMGLPGLRKAKESYGPDHLEVYFCAVETGAV